MELFNRSIHSSVQSVGDDLLVKSVFLDSFHEMKVEILANPQDMVIKKCNADIIRAPHKACYEVADKVPALEGMVIGQGITKTVKEKLGGRLGCVHLSSLFMEAAKALITARYPWLTLKTENLKESIKKEEEALAGTCYAYSQNIR